MKNSCALLLCAGILARAQNSTLAVPAATAPLSGIVPLRVALAPDARKVAGVSYFLRDGEAERPITPESAAPPFSARWDSTMAPAGSYQIFAVVRFQNGARQLTRGIPVSIAHPHSAAASTAHKAASARLLKAFTGIDGSFTTPYSAVISGHTGLLVSFQGRLFAVDLDNPNAPPVRIQLTDSPLTAIALRDSLLFIVSADGYLRILANLPPLYPLLALVKLAGFGLSGVAITKDNLLASLGQSSMTATDSIVWSSQLNTGEVTLRFTTNGAVQQTYGASPETGFTVGFDIKTGQKVTAVRNPTDLLGGLAQVALFPGRDKDSIFITVPGCCGPGIFQADSKSPQVRALIARPFTNAIEQVDSLLVRAGEEGAASYYDAKTLQPLADIDLPAETGFRAAGAIELRSVVSRRHGGRIQSLAGSSWGNDLLRSQFGTTLPAAFLLEFQPEGAN